MSSQESRIRQLAINKPGKLLQLGLEEMRKYLRALNPGEEEQFSAEVVRYLSTVLFAHHSPDSVGVGRVRELRTLAECIDHLCKGRLPQLGDMLMQRFTAVEMSLSEGGWSAARHLEIIPETLYGLASRQLRTAAVVEETRQLKLKALLAKSKDRRGNH